MRTCVDEVRDRVKREFRIKMAGPKWFRILTLDEDEEEKDKLNRYSE